MQYSIEKIKNIIPKELFASLEETFKPSDYNKIIDSFRIKKKSCIRVNTLKTEKSYVMKVLQKDGFKFKDIYLIKDAFIFNENIDNILLKHHLTKEGYIYLQNISSMLPAIILNPEENEKILDIAAAPGSKTTYLAAIMNNKGEIDAIEPNYIRMERLKHNATLLGAKIINFHKTRGEIFLSDKDSIYDKVLVDAPCSGEGGTTIYDKNSYQYWKRNTLNKFQTLQIKLLSNAIRLCKKNGTIVYSTCTLNIIENEMVINEILKKESVVIESIDNKFKEIESSIEPFLSYKDIKFDKSIKNCLRIIPTDQYEGFFICKLKKI